MHLSGCRSRDRETCWKQRCCSEVGLPSALTSGLSTASPRPAASLTAFQEWESSHYLSEKAVTSFLAPVWPTVVLHPNVLFWPQWTHLKFVHPKLNFSEVSAVTSPRLAFVIRTNTLTLGALKGLFVSGLKPMEHSLWSASSSEEAKSHWQHPHLWKPLIFMGEEAAVLIWHTVHLVDNLSRRWLCSHSTCSCPWVPAM